MDTIIELFESAVAEHGSRPAMRIKPGFRTRTWRFADLADQVPRVATALTEAGVQPGDRVMIWAVNRPEWSISFLGAIWAGAIAVPLDFRSTDEFAAKVGAQTRPTLVLASMQTQAAASRLELPMLTIETLVDGARDRPMAPRPTVDPEALAEIVFTSGTTGEPKGVMLSHRNIASNAASLRSVVPLGPETRLLSILPLSHMYGLNPGMLASLIAGALVVYPTSLQPPVLARTFRENRITMLLAVPQIVKLLNNAVERRVGATGRRATFERLHAVARHLPLPLRRLLFRQVLNGFGGALRYLAVGAAAMNPVIAQRWEEMGVESLQGYGATELSPLVAFTRIERNRVGTVGEAIPGVEIKIAPDGEVLVRGPNVFHGYWQRPDATAAVLSDGWYHTGDHGRLEEGRFLVLQGRKKDMLVMPDGTKVFPDDVERVVARDARVRDVTVVGLERTPGELQVHAVLILDDPAAAADVVRQANGQLGGHQQIRGSTVWPDEEFPRTPNMKVRKADIIAWLKDTAGGPAPAAATTAAGAQGAVERLATQLEGVSREAIGRDARLSTDLNIDSLGRVELLTLIEEELGVYVDDAEVEPDTTLGELQAMVDASAGVTAPTGIFGWPLNPLVRAIRMGLWQILVLPIFSLLYRRRISGLEHLRGLTGPVMFAANHHLHNDNALILSAIPFGWRWRLSVAAAADGIFAQPWRGFFAALLGNAFPLVREGGGVRRSFELLGARLDRGYSLLIYPEGKLTVGGPLQPFKSGTGLVAIHGAVPVVPVKLKVNRYSRFDAETAGTALRGDTEVVFGAPLRYGPDVDPNLATEAIQAAVDTL